MRDEQDRLAGTLKSLDFVETFALERFVPDGEHLVDEQDVGVDVNGDREAEPDVHAGGVVLDLVVDEVLEFGEGDDVVEEPVDLTAREPEQRGVQVDVVASGELAGEAGAEFEQRGHPAVDLRRCRWSA